MKALVIDIKKSNGCYNCQIACKDEHATTTGLPMPNPSQIPDSSG